MPHDSAIVQGVVQLVQALGFPVIVAGYFMWRDYKLQDRLIAAHEKIAENLGAIKDKLDLDGGGA